MIRPKYIRFVVSSDKNLPADASSQGEHPCISVRPTIYQPNSLKILTVTPSSTPTARIIINSKHSQLNLPNEITSADTKSPVFTAPVYETCSKSSTSSNNMMMNESSIGKKISKADFCSNTATPSPQRTSLSANVKKTLSPCPENTRRNPKKPGSKIRTEATDSTFVKRSKNWSEAETFSFINIWTEYYTRLTSGGKRNTSIYQSMAQQVNEIFPDRQLTGNDVKGKIGNLVTEYRRKRKQQGRTGASPCTWPYYDAIDKLLGERPYNDDSLLSDSMTIEEELLNDIENTTVPDLNLTQIAQQVDDLIPLTTIMEEAISPIRNNPNNASSFSDGIRVLKANTPDKIGCTMKKIVPQKKRKRTSEIKIDLIQQLLGKIESTTETASQSEGKILNLLEKQTRLQEESVNNEREFLNVFKTIMNNTNSHQ